MSWTLRRLTPLLLFGLIFLLTLSGTLSAQDPTAEPTEAPTAEATALATEAPAPEATAEATPAATPAANQDAAYIIDGATFDAPLLGDLVERFSEPGTFALETSGPSRAFDRFCTGEIDFVMTPRYITEAELETCRANGVEFIENKLAYEGLVFFFSPNLTTSNSCTTLDTLAGYYGIGAEGTTPDIQTLSPDDEAAEISLFAPPAESTAAQLLAFLLPGGELRTDLTPTAPEEMIAAVVASAPPGLGFMTYADFQSITDRQGVRQLQLRVGEDEICEVAVPSSFETANYPAFRPVGLYINQAATEDARVSGFLEAINAEDGARLSAQELGLTPASEVTYARNLNNLTLNETGRTFSRADSPVGLTSEAAGSVTVQGGALSVRVLDSLTAAFESEFPNVVVDALLLGDAAGYAALCAGEAAVLVTDSTPSPEDLAACDEAGIETYGTPLGSEALVFVVSEDYPELPSCVTLDNLVQAFAAPLPEDPAASPADAERTVPEGPTNWQALDPSYPDLPLFAFLPGRSSFEIDALFALAGATDRFQRTDEEANVFYNPFGVSDPALYRAAAVANLEGGGITVLYWNEYQRRLREEERLQAQIDTATAEPETTATPEATLEATAQPTAEATAEATPEAEPIPQTLTRVRLLEVDGGAGCVVPSLETIEDGSYPLHINYHLLLSQQAMEQAPAVR
ncbi:MAG: hypothetical protein HC915_00300 [Anaerolineae bacterium]|nr:hypothetical protein [Anaerolineae bacterium]